MIHFMLNADGFNPAEIPLMSFAEFILPGQTDPVITG